MPCKTCNTTLVIYNQILTCPKCSRLSIIPYGDSICIAQHYLTRFKMQFDELIKPYGKNELIRKIFWEREKIMMSFHDKYSTLNLAKLASCSLLIRRLIMMNEFSDQKIIDNNIIQQIISAYSGIVDFEEDITKLKAGNWNMISLVKYDLNNLHVLPLKDGIRLCPNENYDRVMQTFAKHNILSEETANQKMKEWRKNFVPVEPGSGRITSVKETIKRFYEMISMLYVAFLRSSVYEEAFQIPSKSLTINPIDLRKFNGRYPLSYQHPTEIDFRLFHENLTAVFKGKFKEIISNFVLSEENTSAMPLFLKIDDTIILSQSFCELYCYFLHTITHKQEFDDETERRSKIFEQKIVKSYFEELGFRYFNNFTYKNKLEIDGIAISDDRVFVIEVKGWGSRKLLEEKISKDLLTREIKSAINGIKINYDNKKIKQKRTLNEKVKWVSENRHSLKIREESKIIGLLIINEQPTITEYLGCRISFIDDFEYIKKGTTLMN